MLYCSEIMDSLCIDMLPFGKDVNLLISSFITTSDHISSILIKKINNTQDLQRFYLKTIRESQAEAAILEEIDDPTYEEETEHIYYLDTIQSFYKKYLLSIKYLKKLNYIFDKGGECNFNYYKLKSKLHITEKEDSAEDKKYFNYLLDTY